MAYDWTDENGSWRATDESGEPEVFELIPPGDPRLRSATSAIGAGADPRSPAAREILRLAARDRIAALDKENRQLRERAAAELRAAINADALKAETQKVDPAPNADSQPPELDFYPATCPRCGRPSHFYYTNEEEARRQTPLCWGREEDCPGWSGA